MRSNKQRRPRRPRSVFGRSIGHRIRVRSAVQTGLNRRVVPGAPYSIPAPRLRLNRVNERAPMLARQQSQTHVLALRERWTLSVIRPRADEAERVRRGDESLQTDSTGDDPSFCIHRELCWKGEAAGDSPASSIDSRHSIKTTYDKRNGGAGNCTRQPVYRTHCPQCDYAPSTGDVQEMCRDDEALRELVACWHHLTSDFRVRIMEIARAAR